jgi:hypothetical protein
MWFHMISSDVLAAVRKMNLSNLKGALNYVWQNAQNHSVPMELIARTKIA